MKLIFFVKNLLYILFLQIDELQTKSREERHLEKMIKKTGREIYRLRKAKIGLGELDKHRFQEKLAFFTTSKSDVPPIFEDNSSTSRSSTLKHADPPPSMTSSGGLITHSSGDETHSSSSSTCSTPTPHIKRENETISDSTERFSYDIDPDIGVIV